MGISDNTLNEIEQERVAYLLNTDEIIYAMMAEPLTTGKKFTLNPNISNIKGLEKLNLVNSLVYEEESMGSLELMDTQRQLEFPKRKFHPLRPATLSDELAEDSSYSE